jgi:hypothetical protein
VNIVTKQGGNDFHGDLFEYHQNWAHLSSLNNRERASGQLVPNQNIYNAFGGTVGGPVYLPVPGEGGKGIWKGTDKAFFFFTYQGIRNPFTFTSRAGTGSLAIFGTDLARLNATFPGNGAINALSTLSAFAATNVATVRPRSDLGGTTISSAFNPSPIMRCFTNPLGRCDRQLLIKSNSTPCGGNISAMNFPAAAMAGSSICTTLRGNS